MPARRRRRRASRRLREWLLAVRAEPLDVLLPPHRRRAISNAALWLGDAVPQRFVTGRRVRKLLRDPEGFFRDSRTPVIRSWGLRAYETVARSSIRLPDSVSLRARAEWRNLPARSIVVFLGDVDATSTPHLRNLARSCDSQTELIVLLPARLTDALDGLLRAVDAAPRARVYLFEERYSPELVVRYGIERASGKRVALTDRLGETTPEDLKALLHEQDETEQSRKPVLDGACCARKDELRDAAAGLSHDRDLGKHLGDLAARLESSWTFDVGDDHRTRLFCDYPHLRQHLIERLALLAPSSSNMVVLGTRLVDLRRELEELQMDPEGLRLLPVAALSGFFLYPALEPDRLFGKRQDDSAGVVCFERKPSWFSRVDRAVASAPVQVSVVMTVYNASRTVSDAIDSVLNQSYRNLELIVVDDCSTDDSLAVIRRKARHDERIRVLQASRNGGTYAAKNLGILHASGDFIAVHDSDDVSAPNRIELQVGALLADRQADACCVRYQRVAPDGREIWINGKTHRRGVMAMMFRRQVIDAIGYFDSVRIAADDELVGRLEAASGRRVLVLPSVAYFALHSEGSLTMSGAGAHVINPDGTTTIAPARRAYWEAAQAWHETIASGEASPYVPFPLRKRRFPAPAEILSDRRELQYDAVTASVATIPERAPLLERAIASLLPQVDYINVYLNEYPDVPDFLDHPKITVYRSQETGDLKDNGKFFAADRVPPGYHFTFDDDIVYPADYVARSILTIEKYDRKVAVGTHGVKLADPIESYLDGRTVHHFARVLAADRFVHLIGTGTLAYHTSTLSISLDDFRTQGVADLWFAIAARAQGVPLICQQRPAEWLVELEHDGDTIIEMARRDDSTETAIAVEHGPWSDDAFADLWRPLATEVVERRTMLGAMAARVDVNELAAITGVPPIRFAVIVPGWNCADRVEICWDSLDTQHDGHYQAEIQLIDDGSTDGTSAVLAGLPPRDNVQIHRNPSNRGPAYSRYQAIQRVTDPEAVVVLLDLDDGLRRRALRTIAEAYLVDSSVQATCGNWEDQYTRPNRYRFYCETVVEDRAYRSVPMFQAAPVRSFKRKLCDILRPDDFQDPNGDWLFHCTDVALMLPILEQCSADQIQYIHDPLYVYVKRRAAGTLARFGKPKKAEMYRWLCSKEPVWRRNEATGARGSGTS